MYSVIVPVFNEEEGIHKSYKRLNEIMKQTDSSYELIFVNDGSKDTSMDVLYNIFLNDENIVILNFSRNFGHQNAITAGMDYAKGDAIVVIDADLQDPPEVILKMIEKWKEGYDIVYGKRNKRSGETFFKLVTAKIYYRLLKWMTDVQIPVDTGDFRLIDKKVCESLKKLPEKNRYVRGLVSWVGFRQAEVLYDRDERMFGQTKYPLKKMLKLAIDGITTFSYKPLKFASFMGIFFFAISFIFTIYICYQSFFHKSSNIMQIIITLILFLQGITMTFLGIIGEYIARIYDETKNRPNYIVDNVFKH